MNIEQWCSDKCGNDNENQNTGDDEYFYNFATYSNSYVEP